MDEISSSTHYCEKCKKTMNVDQFYHSNNLEKYPNGGALNQCKKCITMHIDNWKPDTFLWILQEIDVPYIPNEWNSLLSRYSVPGKKLTGKTILGRYLSKMKLDQYNKYSWKDNDYLQELANKRIMETMTRQGYDIQEINDTINKATFPMPQEQLSQPAAAGPMVANGFVSYAEPEEELSDLGMELTDEDKIYLRLKWGKSYRPEEWIALEKMYVDMMESYDIQSAGHIDTLKMVCKTSMKANQLLDIGDVEGAQKMVKMYNDLMKSGNFTALQNKADKGDSVDCIGALVAICETDGFIPRYYTDGPQDKVDRTLQDLQNYTKSLITEETNLGILIEKAVKEIQEQKEKELINDNDLMSEDELLEAELFDNPDPVAKDNDYSDFWDMEDGYAEADDAYLSGLLEDGDI